MNKYLKAMELAYDPYQTGFSCLLINTAFKTLSRKQYRDVSCEYSKLFEVEPALPPTSNFLELSRSSDQFEIRQTMLALASAMHEAGDL